MKLTFCEMLFPSYMYPTNRFNVAKFHAQISTKLKKQRHWFKVHSLKSFKTLLGPFCVVSILRKWSRHLSNFPEILLQLSLPHVTNICKIWKNLSRNGMIIKRFSWGGSQGGANCSYLAMFKPLLLPNYISEQPQYFTDVSNFAKYWKNIIIHIVTFKGQRSWPLKFTVSCSCYKFSKIFKTRHGFISW